MKLDDLLGLAFLIFFVVLPAIQGLMRRGNKPPGDTQPDQTPLPRSTQSQTSQPPAASKPPAAAGPPARQTNPTPPPQPPRPMIAEKPAKIPAKKSKTLEDIERERLARTGAKSVQAPPKTPPQSSIPTITKPESTQTWSYSPEPRAILNGIVWQQVLSEPRSKYWRSRRKPKP